MKLFDNFNGRQASHSSHRAVAYHIKIGNGNAQIGNVQIGNAQIGNIKLGNAEIGRMEWPSLATVISPIPKLLLRQKTV